MGNSPLRSKLIYSNLWEIKEVGEDAKLFKGKRDLKRGICGKIWSLLEELSQDSAPRCGGGGT